MTRQESSEESRKRFAVVYADPPWDIAQKGGRGASTKYDLMPLEEITAMAPAVRELSADNATLLLWVTSAALEAGMAVMKAWGFRFVTTAVWDKGHHLGLGNYFRGSHELLLHGVRGRAPFKFHGQKSVVSFPRTQHSEKPTEMIALIERVLDGPYLELFARARPSSLGPWAIWGNEVDSDISLLPWGYPVPSDFARQGTDGERQV